MWSGDSLNIVLWLGGVAIGAAIGAVGAPSGWRSKSLVWVAVVFGLATIGWIVAPTASPIIQAITPVAVAIATSNAFFMVAVIAVVTIIVGGRNPPALPSQPAPEARQYPPFAVAPNSKWKADITLGQAVHYLGAKSIWRDPFGGQNTVAGTQTALVEALSAKKITSWGRAHPDEGELFEIGPGFWRRADVTLDTDYAFSHVVNAGSYNIHLSQKEMEQVWPPKEPSQ